MSVYGTYDKYQWLNGTNRFSDMQATPPTSLITMGAQAAGDMANFRWPIQWTCRVYAIGYFVTTLLAYDTVTATEVFAIDRRVTFASDTGRLEVGRIDVSATLSLTVGSVRMLEVNHANELLNPGEELILEILTRGAGGAGLAGVYTPFILLEPRAEAIVNLARVTLSTLAQVV